MTRVASKYAVNPIQLSGNCYQYKRNCVLKVRRGRWAAQLTVYLLSLALGAMIFAQMLGLMHNLAHLSHAQRFASPELQHHFHEVANDHGTNGLDALFTSHRDGSDNCRIFDLQGYSDLISSVASLTFSIVRHAVLQLKRTGCNLSGSATPFKARAPPFSR